MPNKYTSFSRDIDQGTLRRAFWGDDVLLLPSEVKELLGIAKITYQRWIKKGKLKPIVMGGGRTYRFWQSQVKDLELYRPAWYNKNT